MKITLITVPFINTRIPPLSLALLAGQLRENGYKVKCFDLNIDAYKKAGKDNKDYWRL